MSSNHRIEDFHLALRFLSVLLKWQGIVPAVASNGGSREGGEGVVQGASKEKSETRRHVHHHNSLSMQLQLSPFGYRELIASTTTETMTRLGKYRWREREALGQSAHVPLAKVPKRL